MFQKETAEASDIGGVGGDGTPSSCYVSPFTNSPRGPRELQPSIFVFHSPNTLLCSSLCVRAFPPRRARSVLRVPVVAPCELGSDARQCCLLFILFFCFVFFFGGCKGKIGGVGVEGDATEGKKKGGICGRPLDRARAHNVRAAGISGITRTGITVR